MRTIERAVELRPWTSYQTRSVRPSKLCTWTFCRKCHRKFASTHWPNRSNNTGKYALRPQQAATTTFRSVRYNNDFERTCSHVSDVCDSLSVLVRPPCTVFWVSSSRMIVMRCSTLAVHEDFVQGVNLSWYWLNGHSLPFFYVSHYSSLCAFVVAYFANTSHAFRIR